MHTTCLAHPIFLNSITRILFSEQMNKCLTVHKVR
jgi:hypothetical protein